MDINLIAEETGLLSEDLSWNDNNVPLQKRGVEIDWIIEFFHKIDKDMRSEWDLYYSSYKGYYERLVDLPKGARPPTEPILELQQITPAFVVPNFIKPLTMKSKSPFYARVPLEFRGTPNLFVSHPWSQKLVGGSSFCTLYVIKKMFERLHLTGNNYVWIDIISYNQHRVENIAYDMDVIISDIGTLGLPVVDSTPFSRLWCLWEILCANKTKSKIDVIAEPSGFRNDQGFVVQMFKNKFRSVTDAQTTLEKDRIEILRAINSTFGSTENANKFIREIVIGENPISGSTNTSVGPIKQYASSESDSLLNEMSKEPGSINQFNILGIWTFKGLDINDANMYTSGFFIFAPNNKYFSQYELTGKLYPMKAEGTYSLVSDDINPKLILYDSVTSEVNKFSISIDFNSMSSFTLTRETSNLNFSRRDINMEQFYAKFLSDEGIALYKQGKYQEAIEFYDKALVIDPNYTLAQDNKKLALEGLYKEKPSNYDITSRGTMPKGWKPTSQHTNTSSHFGDSTSLIDKGNDLVNLGKYQEAIEWFDKALAIEPNNVKALTGKGAALGLEGKYQESMDCFDKTLTIDPYHINALNGKGLLLFILHKYEEAIECFDKVLAIEPNNVDALTNKGVALQGQCKHEEAIECYDKALRVDPNDIRAQDNKRLALKFLSKQKSSSYHETTSRGTMPKGWKPTK